MARPRKYCARVKCSRWIPEERQEDRERYCTDECAILAKNEPTAQQVKAELHKVGCRICGGKVAEKKNPQGLLPQTCEAHFIEWRRIRNAKNYKKYAAKLTEADLEERRARDRARYDPKRKKGLRAERPTAQSKRIVKEKIDVLRQEAEIEGKINLKKTTSDVDNLLKNYNLTREQIWQTRQVAWLK